MQSVLFACLLVVIIPVVNCLRCTTYAEILSGPEYRSGYPYRNALETTNWEYKVASDEECRSGEICIGDAHYIQLKDGNISGMTWTECWGKETVKPGECFWNYRESADYLMYRCACDTEHCHSPQHAIAQWYEGWLGIRNPNPGPFNPYAILPPFVE